MNRWKFVWRRIRDISANSKWMLQITSAVTMRNCEETLDKLNAIGISTGGNFAHNWITVLCKCEFKVSGSLSI